MSRRAGALVALLVSFFAGTAASQDSIAVRHLLSLDLSRLQAFDRTYDMFVQTSDSVLAIGERRVTLQRASYGSAEAWLIVEVRSGSVPSVDSLYLATDFRPLHWASATGPARLAAEFVGDSLLGATGAGRWKQNIVVTGQPDLLVSSPMVETMLALLPLGDSWRDSAAALSVNTVATAVIPAELSVIATEDLPLDSATVVPMWVVAARTAASSIVYWVDKATGAAVRIQQPIPAHVGRTLEFRLRHAPPPALPPG